MGQFVSQCAEPAAGLGTLNCTANDVTLALVDTEPANLPPSAVPTCAPGDEVVLNLSALLEAGASVRYDIGIFVARDGGTAFTGLCNHYKLPEPLAACPNQGDCTVPASGIAPFWDGEGLDSIPSGDLCGDLGQGIQTRYDLGPVTVTCQDNWTVPADYNPATDSLCFPGRCAGGDVVLVPGPDGKLDPIGAIVSWDQQASTGASNSPHCIDIEDAVPGTKSKCNAEALILTTDVFVETPGIDLVKSLDGNADEDVSGTISLGDTLTYGFTVTNTGNVILDPVSLSDPKLGFSDITCGVSSLAPSGETGDSTTCTRTYVVTQLDVDAGSIDNTATATGTPPSGTDVTDQASVSTPIPRNPAISLDKSYTGTVAVDETLTYSYLVTNIGNVTLSSVGVSDPHTDLSVISCPTTTLAPGESMSCSATYVVKQSDIDAGSISNTATAVGTSPSGAPVQAVDSLTITAEGTASIDLDKSAVNGDEDQSGTISVDDVITYSYDVTNDGTVTLDPVTVTDPHAGLSTISCPATSLAPEASMTCTATYPVDQDDVDAGTIDNSALATGTPPVGDDVTSQSDLSLEVPQVVDISIVKSANPDTGLAVDTVITYGYLVTNTGNVTLSNVSVTDAHVGLGTITCVPVAPATLAPAATMTCSADYTVTQGDVDAGLISNTGETSGEGPQGQPASDDDDLELQITQGPNISLTKSLESVVDADQTDTITAGDTLTYLFVVENTGNVTLDPVAVNDPLEGLSAVVCDVSSLAPGESTNCSATYVVTPADAIAGQIDNTAEASGQTPSGGSVTDTDSESVPVESPPVVTEPIPTLSEWGIILLASLLALFGVGRIRRQRTSG